MTNLTTEAEILAKIAALKEEIDFLENDANRLSCMEQAVKIVLNGGYGALGSAAFRWYDETIAEGITATGQVAIRYITKKINEFVNERSGTVGVDYVVSSDTDSVYFCVNDIVLQQWGHITDKQKIVDLIDEYVETQISPYLENQFVELTDYMNCHENKFDMKREAIADTFIIRAKKNYIMRVYDLEGIRFADPYYKMMGIEVVRTSHPQMIRDALEHSLKIVIDGTVKELRDYVKHFRKEYMEAPLYMIAAPRGISDINKYQNEDYTAKQFEFVMNDEGSIVKKKVTIPIHVTAAINYNNLVNTMKLANKWEYIRNGSKIKFLPLKEPNPLKSHVIGFVGDIPSEFGLDEYIDKEMHFSKMFVKPLETFTIFNNWTLEENALLDLFGSSVNLADVAINNKKKPVAIKKSEMKTKSLF